MTPVAPKSTRLGPGWHGGRGGQPASLGRLCPTGPRNVKEEGWGPGSGQTIAEAAPELQGGGRAHRGPTGWVSVHRQKPRGRPRTRLGRSPAGPVSKRGTEASQDGHRRAIGTKCQLQLSQGGGEALQSAGNSNVSPHTPGERVSPAHEGAGLGLGPARGSGHFSSIAQQCLFATPWTAAHQASLSIANSRSLLKLMSIKSVMPSNHLILCRPLLPPSIFPSIRVFPNESALRINWPKYRGFSFSIDPSNEYSGLISFRIDWLHLLAEPRDSQESSATPV